MNDENDEIVIYKYKSILLIFWTNDQIESIRVSDERLRNEFLNNEPKIDGTFKSSESVSKILSRWEKDYL